MPHPCDRQPSRRYHVLYADGFTQEITGPYAWVAYAATDTAHMRKTSWVSIRETAPATVDPRAIALLYGDLDTI
jgi:hypothetical protein